MMQDPKGKYGKRADVGGKRQYWLWQIPRGGSATGETTNSLLIKVHVKIVTMLSENWSF